MRPTGGTWPTLLRWVPVLLWMALIFVLSAQPGLRLSEDAAVDRPSRALAHLLVYAVLGALLFVGLGGAARPTARAARPTARAALLAVALAVLYGISDEIHQALVPERTAQLDDLLLDAAGAVVGVALAVAVSRARRGAQGAPRVSSGARLWSRSPRSQESHDPRSPEEGPPRQG